ncbi:hypothetical protein [Fundidesulfovibrio soli]|uniref:hypothetical protein n=1 Tax=Fundidesulfovibrio soli TaxID=2922716 RepID=UPI001FB0250A|nr:hypothetical protein [Fundidesulfovibrio soli]
MLSWPTTHDAPPPRRPALAHSAPAFLALALLALALGALAGCSRLSASHLQSRPVENGVAQKLAAKFLRFEYTATRSGAQYEVLGTAQPIRENLPAWADSVDDLSVTAYLCDEQGRVLTKTSAAFAPQPIPQGGFPFRLLLPGADTPSGAVFVSFGYRATFVPSRTPAGSPQAGAPLSGQYVFFASEQAALTN